jgi:predicted flap endonuclease-1-like 5' DNA nuclease
MDMSETGWIILVVAVIALALILWLARGQKQAPPADTTLPPKEAAPAAAPATPPPPAAKAPAAPEPAAAATAAAAPGMPDDLLRLKGVGPKIAGILKEQGVTRFAQIAAWSDADIAAIDARLGNFSGRPKRDNWVDQARLLASGDTNAYEAKYGKL